MSPEGESIADAALRHEAEANPADTVFAGAPSGEGWHDESSSGKDLGNAAAVAGYADGGARDATPDVEGFASGNTGTSDLGGSTSGNGAGNMSSSIAGADPTRTLDAPTAPGTPNPGGEALAGDGDDKY